MAQARRHGSSGGSGEGAWAALPSRHLPAFSASPRLGGGFAVDATSERACGRARGRPATAGARERDAEAAAAAASAAAAIAAWEAASGAVLATTALPPPARGPWPLCAAPFPATCFRQGLATPHSGWGHDGTDFTTGFATQRLPLRRGPTSRQAAGAAAAAAAAATAAAVEERAGLAGGGAAPGAAEAAAAAAAARLRQRPPDSWFTEESVERLRAAAAAAGAASLTGRCRWPRAPGGAKYAKRSARLSAGGANARNSAVDAGGGDAGWGLLPQEADSLGGWREGAAIDGGTARPADDAPEEPENGDGGAWSHGGGAHAGGATAAPLDGAAAGAAWAARWWEGDAGLARAVEAALLSACGSGDAEGDGRPHAAFGSPPSQTLTVLHAALAAARGGSDGSGSGGSSGGVVAAAATAASLRRATHAGDAAWSAAAPAADAAAGSCGPLPAALLLPGELARAAWVGELAAPGGAGAPAGARRGRGRGLSPSPARAAAPPLQSRPARPGARLVSRPAGGRPGGGGSSRAMGMQPRDRTRP
jgi:hypothetical protein